MVNEAGDLDFDEATTGPNSKVSLEDLDKSMLGIASEIVPTV
jgi:hypothetical protein